MSIRPDYFRLLDHLGATAPVRALLEDGGDVVALRHDVDHDLDVALEMAFWEHREGRRATYYLLPTAPYWADPLLLEKIRQLDDYGHEVGLHLNVVAEWVSGETDDPGACIAEQLELLRSAGVEVVGTAAHGDSRCYEHGFCNAWCLAELRPDDPAAALSGLSAEGVPSPDPAFRIEYPGDVLTRGGGVQLPLWSVPMAQHGLLYEAVNLAYDRYFSDSGGGWTRTPDPIESDLSRGRHQVLVHPEHWRGRQRLAFVLSTARSGSQWLTGALERASSAQASHEYTLNHHLDGESNPVADNRTGGGFTRLLEDRAEARRLMIQARAIRDLEGTDHVEANVYLAHFLPELGLVFPDARLVHLFRDPRDVVRSLLEQDWYETPEDDRHAPVAVAGWPGLSRLEKCCWHVRTVNEELTDRCDGALALEAAVADPEVLVDAMARIGVAVHRRLLGDLPKPVDTTVDPDDWSSDDRAAVDSIVGPVATRLGYDVGYGATAMQARAAPSRPVEQETLTTLVAGPTLPGHATTVGCKLAAEGATALITTGEPRHGYVLLGGGSWGRTTDADGWPLTIGAYIRLSAECEFDASGTVTVFGLTFADSGELLDTRRLGPLRTGVRSIAFRPRSDGARWNMALHFPRGAAPPEVRLHSVTLEEVAVIPKRPASTQRPGYDTPEDALAATDEFYAAEGFAYSEDWVVSWLRDNVELPSSGRVLDLCCGDGIFSRGFALLNPELELFGIDISAGAIAKARSLVPADAEHFVVGDTDAELPWPDGFFELVFARGPGLYNQHDMDRPATIEVIERWHRVLAPGGRLWSIYSSPRERMGTYTPPEGVKLPFLRSPRRTAAVDFRGGHYNHTADSFCAPFLKARNVEVVSYSFEKNSHVLVTALAYIDPMATEGAQKMLRSVGRAISGKSAEEWKALSREERSEFTRAARRAIKAQNQYLLRERERQASTPDMPVVAGEQQAARAEKPKRGDKK